MLRWSFAHASVCLALVVGCASSDPGVPDPQNFSVRDASARILLDSTPLPKPDLGSSDAGVDAGSPSNMDQGASGDAAVAMGDEACQALAGCLAACDNPECSLACRMAAPQAAAALYDAIFACASRNECNLAGGGYDQACMSEHCDAEMLACLGPPPPGPPPPMGQMTCSELEDCLLECPTDDLACRDNCVVASSQIGFDQLVAVQECVAAADCVDEDLACVLRTCEASLTACYGPVVRPLGDADCSALNTCLGQCPDDDQMCFDGCFRAAGEAGYNAFQSLARCVNGSDCAAGDGDCQRAACGPQFEACFGPQAPPPMGNMNCGDLNECLQNCPEDDRLCVNNCIGRSTQVAYDALIAAYDCLNNADCPDDDAACRQMACQAEIETCLGPPPMPMGNQTCLQFNECLSNCPDDDQDCRDNCIRLSSPEGYRLFEAAIQCINDAGCMPNDVACQQANCLAQIQACLGG